MIFIEGLAQFLADSADSMGLVSFFTARASDSNAHRSPVAIPYEVPRLLASTLDYRAAGAINLAR